MSMIHKLLFFFLNLCLQSRQRREWRSEQN